MAKKPTILLVDDDPDIREFVTFNLAKEGYNVVTAKDGAEGVEAVKKHRPDLVLLDVMMPGMDGIEACEAIRTNPDIASTLIAFLSARGEDYSQVAGFDAGADDYITKPIRPKVLVSRVKALLRRNVKESEPVGNIERGDLLINLEKYQVFRDGEVVDMPRKEFELLHLLASKPGKVFSRDSIMDRVWGSEVVVGGRTIDVHIRKIREKIGDDRIKTIKGVGYKFEE
ncbi:MAG: response regulator transcription factor [Schleiferiaceae bacterium]|jgi:two-component system alkaline phosphatase synthesis response regulator PhoP|nr:MAG: ArsR family transcriptional regulator [Cryomorphaceae bacterium BACL18 MAG-120507-bin74]MDP4730086.1 response regulator transcription factor [Schleiferiaceae bacterium]MDP5015216.1 response regulator transcription factor [Schleiferiaceae bacterium]HAG33789.1 DNA-binding response regulator [Cryomorphaceae bacterium]